MGNNFSEFLKDDDQKKGFQAELIQFLRNVDERNMLLHSGPIFLKMDEFDIAVSIKEIESIVYQTKNLEFEFSDPKKLLFSRYLKFSDANKLFVSGDNHHKRELIGNFQFELMNYCGRKPLLRNDICIGIAPKGYASDLNDFIGYHSNDGNIYNNRDCNVEGTKFNIKKIFGINDYVGCGFNHETGEVFFTLNGEKLKLSIQRNAELFIDFVPTISIVLLKGNIVLFSVIDGYNTVKNPFRFEEMNCEKIFKKVPEEYIDIIITNPIL
jgi:hypothetical protein